MFNNIFIGCFYFLDWLFININNQSKGTKKQPTPIKKRNEEINVYLLNKMGNTITQLNRQYERNFSLKN